MANEAALRSSLVWLAAAMVVVGLCTHSFKKVIVTYIVGMLGIAGVLLPDWDFFDRDFSRWGSPVTKQERDDATASPSRSGFTGFRSYPLRITLYALLYGFALYKWWMFVAQ